MNKEEKFKYLESKTVDKDILLYLSDRFKNLTIKKYGEYKGHVLDIMKTSFLEGWCWETTETCILLLNDEDYIERGYLEFDTDNNYFHSWICFTYNDNEFVLDPCLGILCSKTDYSNTFNTNVLAQIKAIDVKNYFIDYITNPTSREKYTFHSSDDRSNEFLNNMFQNLRKNLSEDLQYELDHEIVVHDKEDINAPMFRNGVGYITELEKGKIKKLTAKYYMNA